MPRGIYYWNYLRASNEQGEQSKQYPYYVFIAVDVPLPPNAGWYLAVNTSIPNWQEQLVNDFADSAVSIDDSISPQLSAEEIPQTKRSENIKKVRIVLGASGNTLNTMAEQLSISSVILEVEKVEFNITQAYPTLIENHNDDKDDNSSASNFLLSWLFVVTMTIVNL